MLKQNSWACGRRWKPQVMLVRAVRVYKCAQGPGTPTTLFSPAKPVISSHKAVRLFRHDFPFITPCWLIPVTFLSFIRLEMASRRICTITFAGIKVRLSSLKIGVTFAFFQISRTSPDHHELSKIIESGIVVISASSLSFCGCIPSCP